MCAVTDCVTKPRPLSSLHIDTGATQLATVSTARTRDEFREGPSLGLACGRESSVHSSRAQSLDLGDSGNTSSEMLWEDRDLAPPTSPTLTRPTKLVPGILWTQVHFRHLSPDICPLRATTIRSRALGIPAWPAAVETG